jgi:flagellar basal-body rod modification protein FlgD
MSAINTSLPIPTPASPSSTTSATGGFNSLTPSDFIQMMVTQLENQDPLNPTSSQDLLSQMSSIGQLQSSDTLQTTLTSLSLQSQIGSASSLIGKYVQGTDANQNAVTGTVTSVSVNQAANTVALNLDSGGSLPLANVTGITTAPAVPAAAPAPAAAAAAAQSAATAAAATTATQSPVQSLLSAVGGILGV